MFHLYQRTPTRASKKLVAALKEKAAAVRVLLSEVRNPEEAMAYALDVTRKQGGADLLH